MDIFDHFNKHNSNVNALYSLFNDLIYWSNQAINGINQLTDWNQHRVNDINELRNWNNARKNEITDLQIQNKNQADNIATLTNSLNEKAITIAALMEQNMQQTQDFKALKYILCSHIDCNTEVMGVVEPGTDGLNQML